MKSRHQFLDQIYEIDQRNNAYMIEVALDQYTYLFNEWDPAPFKRRELDVDLQQYLESSCDEIPAHYDIELCFTLSPGTQNAELEHEARLGLENSFKFKLYLLKQELRRINTRMIRYVFAGLGTLFVAHLLAEKATMNTIASVLNEGLFVGAWVFLWEAVSLFFFSNRDLYDRYKTLKRLRTAQIIFQEST
ncbi:hypothetical protein L3556_11300 [Candidatus Synechococcus calcipolaris G9]|uniref:SMODS and SLOG-associating 2TM effector domain-containing protein n=1 Tax=Candidatus Synechococcus calcipolaris G9 TaxID=1497997 RepID=A0ABT6F0W9_9SYNE|nr:hypothetical protein [Candidatus Synechococcus calcipolaris]MDG2991510.1 hypothetical protein [Candidatus Synechococcus calcipolaris G9]